MPKPRVQKKRNDPLWKRIKIPEELSTPPQVPTFNIFSNTTHEEYERQCQSYMARRAIIQATAAAEKLPFLFDRYGLPRDNDWFRLCLAMATEFFDGFKLENKGSRGAKPIWIEGRLVLLWLNVQERIAKGISISQACCNLSQQKPYCDWLRGEEKNAHKTLTNRYWEAEKYVQYILPILRKLEPPSKANGNELPELLYIMAGTSKNPPEN